MLRQLYRPVAEVSLDDNRAVKVHGVVYAIDCGGIINPETIKAQVESVITFGAHTGHA